MHLWSLAGLWRTQTADCSAVAASICQNGLCVPSAGQRVLIHVGRDGQVLNGSELVGMSRVKPDAFRLILPKVQRSDSGLYFCQIGRAHV